MPFLGASDRRAPTLVARDQGSAAPLPPGDFDAFPAFLGDPDGHPLPVADRASGAPVAPALPESDTAQTDAPSVAGNTRHSPGRSAVVEEDVAALQDGIDHASVAGDRHDEILLADLDADTGGDAPNSLLYRNYPAGNRTLAPPNASQSKSLPPVLDPTPASASLTPAAHPDLETPDNVTELARVMWSEARGVGTAAMTAVGWTVVNRMIRNHTEIVSDVWNAYSHSAG